MMDMTQANKQRYCPTCNKVLRDGYYYCSVDCMDIDEGEGPRRAIPFDERPREHDVHFERDYDRGIDGRNSGYGT